MRRAQGRYPGSVNRGKLAFETLLILAAIVLIILALYAAGRRVETGMEGREVHGDLNGLSRGVPRITYEGITYEPKELTTVLLMGVDKSASASSGGGGFRSGGQADFLMLLLIDHASKTITPLQIDRDTMAQITVLGVLGGDAGTRNAQICLSHGFGDGGEQSCLFTRKAVSNLLMGVGIDFFVAMNMDGISVLNDAVGGVPVTLEDDFSALDPAMRKGVTLTLHGDQAEYYVRNRRDIGIGTNERRMERQKVYLKALSERLSAVFRENRDFMDELYGALEPYLQTDMKRGRMINETWRTRDYASSETVWLRGEHSVGEDGFMEFHPDQAALQKMVVDLFYQAAR